MKYITGGKNKNAQKNETWHNCKTLKFSEKPWMAVTENSLPNPSKQYDYLPNETLGTK